MKKLPLLLLCILLMTGCVSIDKQSRMNAYFASMILGQQQGGGASELIQFTNENGELTNDVPSIVLSSDTKEATFTFETPYKWSVDEETLADWISLSKTSGKAGKVELIITFEDNTSCNARDAVINIKSGDYTYHIKVHQDGNGASVDVSDDTEKTIVKVTPADPESKSAEALIPVEEGFSESKPTVIEIEGVGNITFDPEATAKILENAQAEGATNVYFKVEDVTTTNLVPDADVVLEVTMKTVDENGVEVYREGKAAGEVTIEIPMDENVAYVHRVTLVNDAGEPVEGGVVAGSEKIENGILSFKVNHFSKYAVDYVTKDQFVSVTGVILNLASVTLPVGDDNLSIFVTITPDNATNKKVTWSSSDESVATVDASGKITAVDAGEAIITVTTENGGFSATCTVTVNRPVTFKAVYDTKGGANTLTFYYDANNYSGEGITVYDNLPTAATKAADWGYNDKRGEIKSVVIDASVADNTGLTSTAYMFQDMATATNISGAEYLDVSNVTDMSFMFNNFGGGNTALNSVPNVSGWNTGNVTNMTGMFESYGNFSSSLDKVPDVSNWNTGKVTNMKQMFNNYGSTSGNISCVLDLSGWDLSKITGTNGVNVFNFNPRTFDVTIPAKTGEKSNEGGVWYYGNGTNYIAPPAGETFTLPLAGALKGVFSVSATKKVHFSQGNLTYNVTDTKWAFYEHQYDCATGYDSNLISLFTWGYDATKSIVPDGKDYVGGHSTDGESFSKAEDWGYVFGGESSVWRTLTKDEWVYLFNTRTMTNSKARYSNAVDGVTIGGTTYKGVFLYPDNYNGEVVSSSMTWDAINAAGIVFLPVAGNRNGSSVDRVGKDGYYWSSSAFSSFGAYIVLFDIDSVCPPGSFGSCDYGYSVRLVTEVPASASTIESFNMKDDDSSNWN